jgi:alpha-mannosidase
VDAFVEQCRQLANVTRGPDIMLTMGSDFQFQNAHLQYKNLDKLIHYVNQDGRVNALHSTPAECVRRVVQFWGLVEGRCTLEACTYS